MKILAAPTGSELLSAATTVVSNSGSSHSLHYASRFLPAGRGQDQSRAATKIHPILFSDLKTCSAAFRDFGLGYIQGPSHFLVNISCCRSPDLYNKTR